MSQWQGCMLATRNADYYHAAFDYATRTLCELPLTGMSETNVTPRMGLCPACAKQAGK